MTNADLAARNAAMLAQINTGIRAKVAAVLADLQGHGYRPRIQQAWRTPEQQADALASGHSTVKWSFHMATTKEGKPDALAADILDDDDPNERHSTRFFLLLCTSARTHGLNTGTLWGLNPAQKGIVNAAIESKAWDKDVRLGWDAGHVEVSGITLGQAKSGKRSDTAANG